MSSLAMKLLMQLPLGTPTIRSTNNNDRLYIFYNIDIFSIDEEE